MPRDRESIAVQFRPSRCNFAGVCIYCGTRWCQSPECVARHEASSWAVCPDCAGGELDADGYTVAEREVPECTCAYGVIEVSAAEAEQLAAFYLSTAPAGAMAVAA